MENLTNENNQSLNYPENGYALTGCTAKYLPAGLKISQLIVLIIYIITFGFGCYGINKCPVDNKIPQFLIATGAVGVLSILFPIVRNKSSFHPKLIYVDITLYIIQLVLSVLGIYWVVRQYKPNYDPGSGQLYCNKTVYIYAFSFLAIAIIIPVIFAGFTCFLMCIYFVRYTAPQNEDVEGQPTTRN